jgi:NADH:ubiquinone oxidoreductase subunit 2 (subunit N)
MIPMNLSLPGGGKASVTWASVFWIGVVTAIGTVIGTYVYARWVQKLVPTGTGT